MSNLDQRKTSLMMEGAARYAAADKSDPFAYSRAVSHIKNGVATFGNSEKNYFYDAEVCKEERTLPITGEKYTTDAYKNVVRP